jgi:membrane associated rhomboid family serine protease
VFPLKDNIPTRRFPILTVAIIVLNVVVFFGFQDARVTLAGAGVNEDKVVEYGAIPYELTHPGKECFAPESRAQLAAAARASQDPVVCEGQGTAPDDLAEDIGVENAPAWITIFSSMFMHGGLLHIAGNMLFLWIFGNNIEDSMGRARFVLFYLLGGAAALAAQTAIDPSSTAPTIGASGAVAAVLGGYALLYPRARVVTLILIIFFITIVELPAVLVLGAWFLIQLFYGAADLGQPLGGSGGVAYFAHIGGFVFGLILIKAFANRIHRDYEIERQLPVY